MSINQEKQILLKEQAESNKFKNLTVFVQYTRSNI